MVASAEPDPQDGLSPEEVARVLPYLAAAAAFRSPDRSSPEYRAVTPSLPVAGVGSRPMDATAPSRQLEKDGTVGEPRWEVFLVVESPDSEPAPEQLETSSALDANGRGP